MDQCFLCQVLLDHLKRKYGKALNPANYESFCTEVCWQQDADLEGKDTLYFIITNPSRARDQWNFCHFFRMELWHAQSFSRHFDLPASIKSSTTYHSLSENPTSTNSQISRSLAISWLSRCRTNEGGKHQECNKRDGDYLPTRLLDIRYAQETSHLRLVCVALDPVRFAEDREWMTLSHCWGAWGAKENPILKKDNLEERQRTGLKMADLPKTFRDAVEIAGWLKSERPMTLVPCNQ